MNKEKNLLRLKIIATKLQDLRNEVVFLGGCTTGIFITEGANLDVRPTLDVDCIVDVISVNDYYKLEKKLRAKGFKNDLEIICRWNIDGILLDVMPVNGIITGAINSWYEQALKNKQQFNFQSNESIYHVTAPYFLATKLEAFKNRSKNDFLGSHDLEDIICVIDGRPEIISELETSSSDLKEYMSKNFTQLLKNRNFIDALPGHLNNYGSISNQRTQVIITRIENIANLKF